MPYIENHVNCCGVRHLIEFDEAEEDDNVGDIEEIVDTYPMAQEFGGRAINPVQRKLIEVILNQEQVNGCPLTIAALKEKGFRLVSEFNNSSGSDCYVFHRNNAGIRGGRPAILDNHFPLGEAAQRDAVGGRIVVAPAPEQVEQPPVRTLFSTFHCVFADGRRGAGYDTQEEARRNLGRRRQIDRRNILSNGEVVWEVNV